MKKIINSVLVLTLLVTLFMPSKCFAGQWKTVTIPKMRTQCYTSESFYNDGQPHIKVWFDNRNGYFEQPYIIELQQYESGYWTDVVHYEGSVEKGRLSNAYVGTDTVVYGTFRYVVTLEGYSTRCIIDGEYEYFE